MAVQAHLARKAGSVCFVLSCIGLGLGQTTAPLPLRPSGIAFDSAGDLYFTDARRHQVYEISLAGKLSVIAGSGTQGFAGDGGAATSAQLNEPHGIAIGGDGTVYIADTGNARVRALHAGIISSVAGQGTPGYNGDTGPALAVQLNRPAGLALAADGSLYIADSANQRVRLLRAGAFSTVAGNGVQGSAGDGGAAGQAQLDAPEQLALAGDGRLFIADAHRGTLRVVSPAGTISLFAGSGVQGFSGDGGAALQAKLYHPQGIAVSANGEVYFADSGNQRVRAVQVDGTIRTVVGTGTQGTLAEGTGASAANLDGPESLAFSPLGLLWFSDARNATVRAVSKEALIFQPAGLVTRNLTLGLQALKAVNGQTTLTVQTLGTAGLPQGRVRVLENGSLLAETQLSSGSATLSWPALAAGAHTFVAEYEGDVLNPAATASTTITDAGLTVLTATPNPATMRFGDDVPALTGTLAGIAPQDIGNVFASFGTTATVFSSVGVYPITATLSGVAAAGYVVQIAPAAGQLTVTPAQSIAAMLTPAPIGYDGLPLTLSGTVSAVGRGKPTGSVSFVENGTVLATAGLVNGSATVVLPASAVGLHAVVARYSGDGNFLPSDSAAQQITVNTLPDFRVAHIGTDVPTMSPGTTASFLLEVSAAPPPFTGVVAFAASGLPTGWTARFAPANVVPGTGSANVTMTLTASGTAAVRTGSSPLVFAAILLLPFSFLCRRRGPGTVLIRAVLPLALLGLSGCGDRVASTADLVPPHPATFSVTATSTNLASQVVTHAVVISYLQP